MENLGLIAYIIWLVSFFIRRVNFIALLIHFFPFETHQPLAGKGLGIYEALICARHVA